MFAVRRVGLYSSVGRIFPLIGRRCQKKVITSLSVVRDDLGLRTVLFGSENRGVYWKFPVKPSKRSLLNRTSHKFILICILPLSLSFSLSPVLTRGHTRRRLGPCVRSGKLTRAGTPVRTRVTEGEYPVGSCVALSRSDTHARRQGPLEDGVCAESGTPDYRVPP